MNNPALTCIAILLCVSAWAQTNAPVIDTSPPEEPITAPLQDVLVEGPTPIKMHALAMITQGKVIGEVDESYLPGLTLCAKDPEIPIRSTTAKLLGQHFVDGLETPNPEAVDLLIQLAGDESAIVRRNAVEYGLTKLNDMPPEVIECLIVEAAVHRAPELSDTIAESLTTYQDETVRILNEKLGEDDPISYFEIYEQLTGMKPKATDRLLDMPSSQPVIFIFTGDGDSGGKLKADVEIVLKDLGLLNAELMDMGADDTYAVLLKTYLTRDRIMAEEAFAAHETLARPQMWYLTPEWEKYYEDRRNK